MLQASLLRYQNRSIDSAQAILELIELANEMREPSQPGEELGLSPEKLAFYGLLAKNHSAVEALGGR